MAVSQILVLFGALQSVATALYAQTLVCGEYATCTILESGSIQCWGSYVKEPVGSGYTQLTMYRMWPFARKDNGEVWGPGSGLGGAQPRTPPDSPSWTNITRVQNGYSQNNNDAIFEVSFIRVDGTVFGRYQWPTGSYTQIGGGVGSMCAIRTDGVMKCTAGALNCCYGADNSPPSTEKYLQVNGGRFYRVQISYTLRLSYTGWMCPGCRWSLSSNSFVQLDVNYNNACALRLDGGVECYGDNNYGVLDGVPSGSFSSVCVGMAHACALGADGSIVCWGSNIYGQASPPAGIAPRVGCPAGSAGKNIASCELCRAGTFALAYFLECDRCWPGWSSGGGAVTCFLCGVGQYSEAGQLCTQCACATGRFCPEGSSSSAGIVVRMRTRYPDVRAVW